MFPEPSPSGSEGQKGRRGDQEDFGPHFGALYSERGIELACRLGEEQKAEIYLVTVLEVPRTLPLEAPMPEAEANAKDIIKRGEEIVSLRGLVGKGEVKRGSGCGGGDHPGG